MLWHLVIRYSSSYSTTHVRGHPLPLDSLTPFFHWSPSMPKDSFPVLSLTVYFLLKKGYQVPKKTPQEFRVSVCISRKVCMCVLCFCVCTCVFVRVCVCVCVWIFGYGAPNGKTAHGYEGRPLSNIISFSTRMFFKGTDLFLREMYKYYSKSLS